MEDYYHYLAQNPGLVSLSRPKMLQHAGQLSTNYPKCGISITMSSIRSLGLLFGARPLRGGFPGPPRRPYIYKLLVSCPSGRILIMRNSSHNNVGSFEGVCLSNYRHPGSSARREGSARQLCHLTSGSTGSTDSTGSKL